MVKRGSKPSWHLTLTAVLLVVATATALFLHWRDLPSPEQYFGGGATATRPAAFADSLAGGVEAALAEVGIWLELIDVRRRAAGPGGDHIQVRVPADLPLPMANVAVTGLVRRLDGRVLQGTEEPGRLVLYCGPQRPLRGLTRPDSTWPDGATTQVTLRRDRGLRRRTGRIAIVLDSLAAAATEGHFLDRLLALPHPLTLNLQVDEARSSQFAERLIMAGHQVIVGMPSGPVHTAGGDWPPGDLIIDQGADPGAVEEQLWELAFLAADRGQAIGMGRGRDRTLQALEALLPRLETRGHEIVTLSALTP